MCVSLQVQQQPEQLHEMTEIEIVEIAEEDLDTRVMWDRDIPQEISKLSNEIVVRNMQLFDTHEEIEYEGIPELIDEKSEEILGPVIYKLQLLDQIKYQSRAPGGPIIDKVIEAHVTHWQEQKNQDQVQQRQEIKEPDRNVFEHAEVFGGEEHNFHHGAVFSG